MKRPLGARATFVAVTCSIGVVMTLVVIALKIPDSTRDLADLQAFRSASVCDHDPTTDPTHPTCIAPVDGLITNAYARRSGRSGTSYYVTMTLPGFGADTVIVGQSLYLNVGLGDRVRADRWGRYLVHFEDLDRGIGGDTSQTPLSPVIADTVLMWTLLVVLWLSSVCLGLTALRAQRDTPVDLASGPVTFYRLPTTGSRSVIASAVALPVLLIVALIFINDVSPSWTVATVAMAALLIVLALRDAGHPVITLSMEGVRVGDGHGVLQPWSDVQGIKRVTQGRSSFNVIAFRDAAYVPVSRVVSATSMNQPAIATIRAKAGG